MEEKGEGESRFTCRFAVITSFEDEVEA